MHEFLKIDFWHYYWHCYCLLLPRIGEFLKLNIEFFFYNELHKFYKLIFDIETVIEIDIEIAIEIAIDTATFF